MKVHTNWPYGELNIVLASLKYELINLQRVMAYDLRITGDQKIESNLKK